LEKAREIGQHCLSGALLDPRSMRELLPDFEKEAPLDAPVSKEAVYFLTEKGKFRFPITPPPLRDHGNHVISLNRFVKWLGGKVEAAGVTVFTGFAGSELLYADDGGAPGVPARPHVSGVRTDDKGLDKNNQPKSNFEPGYDLQAKITILAEGARGSLTKQLIQRFDLMKDRNPQTYGQGIKELWEVPSGRIAAGEVIYAMGWPLTEREYGGVWIYGRKDELWKVRNFHQGFEHGFWHGMIHAGIQQFTGGRGVRARYTGISGYERMKPLRDLSADGGPEAGLIGHAKGDGKLTFDKLTDLYHSGTKHEEDQPAHLIIHDTNIRESRCIREYGKQCQNFC